MLLSLLILIIPKRAAHRDLLSADAQENHISRHTRNNNGSWHASVNNLCHAVLPSFISASFGSGFSSINGQDHTSY